jgi:anhydro-N-acetylmuramic acid kinase
MEYDENGDVAAAGKVHDEIVEHYMRHPYFRKHPPKSLDRGDFKLDAVMQLSPEDGAATLTRFTVDAIVKAEEHFPAPPVRWLVCGGGMHNQAIMTQLRARLGEHVFGVDSIGWNGDALEAQAFGFLAVRSLKRLPVSLPTTTGVSRMITGGAFYQV